MEALGTLKVMGENCDYLESLAVNMKEQEKRRDMNTIGKATKIAKISL